MTSSINLKKIISVGAAALLAIGGALTSTGSASAAEVTTVALGGGAHIQSGMGSISLGATGCNSYTGTINLADWQLTSTGGQTLTSVSLFGYMVIGLSSNLTGGETVTITYTKNVSRIITCGNGDTVGSFTFSDTAPGQVVVTPGTVVSNPATPTYNAGAITSTAATWQSPSVNKRSYWLICSSSHPAATGNNSNPRPTDCGPISATALNNQSPTWINTNPYTIPATINKWVSCNGGCITTSVSTTGAFFTWYEYDSGNWTMSATIGADGSTSVASVSAPVLTPEQARNQIKPLPVIVQPFVAAIPVLNKPMVNAGGKLDLSAGDFSGLVSASISGKPLDLTLGAKGGLTITVPNGQAGKTADLFLKFTTGTVIIQDAIKYVAPVVVADVPTRPVSIAAGSTKLSQETADQVRQAAFANMKNNTVSCVAYAANGSAAARAAALATAEQVCALATKANPDLTATPVTVVVDKAKAKTEAVGIKVYKN